MQNQHRQLAAILFTDIVGYTAMMQQNETQAVAVVRRYISVLQKAVSEHQGAVLNDYGDGSLCTFSSATNAVRCAMTMQQQLQTNPSVPLRIGLHVGEIFFEEGKVLGDGVNVASRIQSLGKANTILFSKEICDKIRNQTEFKSISLGLFEFKNVDDPVEVFALANEGLIVPRHEHMEGKLKENKKKPAQRRWVIWAIAVLLFLSGAFFIYKRVIESKGFTGGEKSIAVLPFDDIGLADTQAYLSDGITEDIINKLSKISSLHKVIGWFSVKNFRKTTKSAKQIADELGVTAILTGTIQNENGNIHIIAELDDVSTNLRLWGEDYTYTSKDILSIQSSVASEIATALKANLTPEEKKNLSRNYTENVDAYKYYILGRTYWNARSRTNFDSAEANFKKAVSLDADYALAYAGIADCYIFNLKGIPQMEAVPIARAYATKALSIDSTLSEGLTTLGFIQFIYDYDWTQAKKTLEKALEFNPNNSPAHLYYGMVLQYTGDPDRGLKEQEKAVELDPLAFSANWVLGRNYYFAGKYNDAIKQIQKAAALAPKGNSSICIWSLGLVYLGKKMYPEALAEYEKIPDDANDFVDNLHLMKGYAYAETGDKTKAKQLLAKAIKEDPGASVYRLAQVYVALGDFTQALNYLEKGYNIRDLHMFWIKADPAFDPIKNEPRFKTLLKKMNLE